MKKKISSILGVMLTAVLLATLAIGAAVTPASADVLNWSAITYPTAAGQILQAGTDVTGIAVANDGSIYATVWNGVAASVRKSTNGGISWTTVITGIPAGPAPAANALDAPIVALKVAPDDPNVLAIVIGAGATTTPNQVYTTANGGALWSALSPLPVGTLTATEAISCLDVSPATAWGREFMVGTAEPATGAGNAHGNVVIFGQAANVHAWADQGLPATEDYYAVAFSPGYAGDRVILAVGADVGAFGVGPAGGNTFLHIRNTAGVAGLCDRAQGFPTYPRFLETAISASPSELEIVSADVVLPVDFDGTTPVGRMAYVAFSGAAGPSYDVYRATDLSVIRLNVVGGGPVGISTIAFDGTLAEGKLLAGQSGSALVWRTSNPQAAVPSWLPASKGPTGTAATQVALAANFATSDTAYAGTSGSESAFSVSVDGGRIWNQRSLIDTVISNLLDVAPSSDYANDNTLFLATENTGAGFTDGVTLGANVDIDLVLTTAIVGGPVTVTVSYLNLLGVAGTVTTVIPANQGLPYTAAALIAAPNCIDVTGISILSGTTVTTGAFDITQTARPATILGSHDLGGPESLWKSTVGGAFWERVRTLAATTVAGVDTAIVRLEPDYATNPYVYLVDAGGTAIQMSADGGQYFVSRTAPGAVADLAVESTLTIYAAIDGAIRKSTNGGWSWGLPVDGRVGTINTIDIAADGDILLGSAVVSAVSRSTDGGTSFSPIPVAVPAAALVPIEVVSDADYATNSTIYAAGGGAGAAGVYRFVIGTSSLWSRIDNVNPLSTAALGPCSGFAVGSEGTLYAADSTVGVPAPPAAFRLPGGMVRSLDPTVAIPVPAPLFEGVITNLAATAGFGAGIRLAEGGHLFAIDTANNVLYAYTDTIAPVGPTLVEPADGEVLTIARFAGFAWTAVSGATQYELQYATRADFTNRTSVFVVAPNTTANVNLPIDLPYNWRVRVRIGFPVVSRWSEVWVVQPQLTTGVNAPIPRSPAPISRTNVDVTLQPVFNWSALLFATSYKVQLANDAAFTDLLADETLGNVTSWQCPTKLAYSTTYYWRVKGVSAVTSTDWSAGVGFTTMAKPVAPIVVEEAPPAPIIEVPTPIPPAVLWAIVAIGAILVIAVIVLIVRTRRAL